MLHIAYISADWGSDGESKIPIPGGANAARCITPATALREAGHDVVVGCGVGVRKDGFMVPLGPDDKPAAEPPEIIVLQRWMRREAAEHITRAREVGQVVIQDVDDAYHVLDPRNAAHAATDPERSPDVNREHYMAALAASDHITVSTPWLRDSLRSMIDVPVTVIRNSIDTTAYRPRPVRPTTEELVVGWVGGVPWRSGDLETLDPWLDKWLEWAGATFSHMGALADKNAAYRLAGVGYRRGPTLPMVASWDYAAVMSHWPVDIGLVPLNMYAPFNLAKSAIKGLEYAAAGIPYIAAPTPEYASLGAGEVAKVSRWPGILDKMREPAHRERVRARGLRIVADHDIARTWERWEACYQSLLPVRT